MTKYTYTKTINKAQLSEEITTSAIASQFDHIDLLTGLTTFNVWFKTALSGSDLIILNDLVAAHVPSDVQNVALIQDTTSLKDPFTNKMIVKTEPYNGPLYAPFCRFKTGLGSGDASWEPPPSNAVTNFWTIDVATPGYTKISFLPTFNYQIDGIGYRVLGTPVGRVTMHQVLLAPTVPAPVGSYTFTEGKLLGAGDYYERYTAPKYLKNYGVISGTQTRYHELQFIIKHPEGEHVELEVWISVYPQ